MELKRQYYVFYPKAKPRRSRAHPGVHDIFVKDKTARIIPLISQGEEDLREAMTLDGSSNNEALAMAKSLLDNHHPEFAPLSFAMMEVVRPRI